MQKAIAFITVLFLYGSSTAQYKVSFSVFEMTELKRDSVYISGTFNNWDSARDKRYKLQPDGKGFYSITLTIPAGPQRYKYTGGNWNTVEKLSAGSERPDRPFILRKDTTINDTVFGWRDMMLQEQKQKLPKAQNDTSRLIILNTIAVNYAQNPDYYNVDSALHYIQLTSQQLNNIKTSAELNAWSGYADWLGYTRETNASFLHALGNYPKSLEYRLENLQLAEKIKKPLNIVFALINLLDDYVAMKDDGNILAYCKKLQAAIQQAEKTDPNYSYYNLQAFFRIAYSYYALNIQDTALFYIKKANDIAVSYDDVYSIGLATQITGDIYSKWEKTDSAFFYYGESISRATSSSTPYVDVAVRASTGIAKLFQKANQVDSALKYALFAYYLLKKYSDLVKSFGQTTNGYLADIAPIIAQLYKAKNQPDSAYEYLQLSVDLKDSLYNAGKVRQFQNLTFSENMRQQQLEQQNIEAKQRFVSRIKIYSLIFGMAALLSLALVLFRNNKQKQHANLLLTTQKEQIQSTLTELKNTQTQLIHSEKMASLGELTAGIAHEIQNPLNFVNNFSDVNSELLQEMKDEINKGHLKEANTIANDLIENEKKINYHGKRAETIVKGMLQHSRTGSGQKESTDLNKLVDEYLQLTYHGFRAKDKSFNATLETSYDSSIGNIGIVAQDIGRVFLNLYNNAFYAVNEKKKQQNGSFSPVVRVTTKKIADAVEIRISDNGDGIPQQVVDKIFQPFFTTKPTGQGTGLGLSLSYDIVKAHGGEINVETRDDNGSLFIIKLPL